MIIVRMPAKTRIKIAALNRAPIFIPLLLSHVSKRIRIIAESLILKFSNGKNTPPMLKCCHEERTGGKWTMLFSDWEKTYARAEMDAVCMTIKSDQPKIKAKKRLYIFW